MHEDFSRDTIGPDCAPARRDDLTSVELDGEMVVYAHGTLHKLDSVATMLWNSFDGATTLDVLADELAAIYSATDRTTILDDMTRCVGELERRGLLMTR